jgi:hypothetical protein
MGSNDYVVFDIDRLVGGDRFETYSFELSGQELLPLAG